MSVADIQQELAVRLAEAQRGGPEAARAWLLVGSLRFRLGDHPGARAALEQAARLTPSDPAPLFHLAEVARAARDPAAAEARVRQAAQLIAAAPRPETLIMLSKAWLDLGRYDPALDAATAALARADQPAARQLFVAALRGARRIGPGVRDLVARALEEAWGQIALLQRPAAGVLKASWPQTDTALAGDPLLAAVLSSGPVQDPELEGRLTALRRRVLLDGLDLDLNLRAGLARQGFANEYAWIETDAETVALAAVADRLAAGPTAADALTWAANRALADAPGAEAWDTAAWPEAAQTVLSRQLDAPRLDAEAAAAIPTLTPLGEGVTAAVRDHYEESPYPRWTEGAVEPPAPLNALLRGMLPRAEPDPIPNAAAPEVLIAGCGTGQQAVHIATRYAGCRVLAVDLSRASLGYAQRKAQALGIGNLSFGQADLMELAALGRSFDAIECVGVLHHMADPFAGARVLAGLLRPGGVMRLALYSRAARQMLGPAKALAAREGLSGPDGARRLRKLIYASPQGAPERVVLGLGDFFSTSGCRDLLMHAHELQMSMDDLGRITAETGLNFLGFTVPPEVLNTYLAETPGDPTATDLAGWAAFEAKRPTAFIGMYRFWLQKPHGASKP